MSEDCLTRVKAVILISLISFLGMCLNLLLFSLNASVVLDDLVDGLVKVDQASPLSPCQVAAAHCALCTPAAVTVRCAR